jgi:ATP-dependent protease ClpP protease subunit
LLKLSPQAETHNKRRQQMPRNFEARVSGDTLEINMYGPIGEDFKGDGSRVDVKAFAKVLNSNLGAKQIALNFAGPGGDPFHALAMYEMLKVHSAKKVGRVMGLTASAMTLPLMACDEIEMSPSALLMLHRSAAVPAGRPTAQELRATAEIADLIDQKMTAVYAAKSGLPEAEIVAMLYTETWLTADDAKAKGFASSIVTGKTVAAEFKAEDFSNVPERIAPILASLQQKDVPMPEPTPAPAPVAPVVPAPVAEVPKVEAKAPTAEEILAADRERIAQINAQCRMAGHPEKADEWITSGTSVAVVAASLLTVVCAERQPPNGSGTGGLPEDKPKDGNERFRAEFSAEATYAKTMTEAEYIAMRRVDEGLDVLTTGTSK